MSSIRSPRSVGQRRDSACKIVEPRCQLSLCRALIDVCVPAAEVGERHLDAEIRLGQLRDLLQRLSERATRIVGAVGRRVVRRIGRLQHLDRVKRLVAGALEHAVGRRRIQRLERRIGRIAALSGADRELVDLSHRDGGRWSLQHPRKLAGQRDRTERRGGSDRVTPEDIDSASRRWCSSRQACRFPCSPARRSATAWRSGIRRRGRWRAVENSRAARADRIRGFRPKNPSRSIGRGLTGARLRDGDARTRPVVLGVAERHDDAEAVHGASLKNRDQLLRPPGAALREGCPRQKRRREADTDQSECAVLQEHSSRNHDGLSESRIRSGRLVIASVDHRVKSFARRCNGFNRSISDQMTR